MPPVVEWSSLVAWRLHGLGFQAGGVKGSAKVISAHISNLDHSHKLKVRCVALAEHREGKALGKIPRSLNVSLR